MFSLDGNSLDGNFRGMPVVSTDGTNHGRKRRREEDDSQSPEKYQKISEIAYQAIQPLPAHSIYPSLDNQFPEPSAPPPSPPRHDMEIQLNTILLLQQSYCVSCDLDTLKMLAEPFILTDKDYEKTEQKTLAPFVLRQKNEEVFRKEIQQLFPESTKEKVQEIASQVCGDFQLIGNFYHRETRTKKVEKEFSAMEALFVLPDGKIQHGRNGRIYDNFAKFKLNWRLGDFLYDAYIKQQSDLHDEEAVMTTLLQASLNCFLPWKDKNHRRFVSIRQNEGQGERIDTFEIQFGGAGCLLIQEGTPPKEVLGELFTFLTKTFHVGLYKQVQEIASFLDTKGHDFTRLLRLGDFHTPVIHREYYTLAKEVEGFSMKTYILQKNAAWKETTYSIHTQPNGYFSITNQETKTVETTANINQYLERKHSVKRLEEALLKQQAAIKAIVENIKVETQSIGCWREMSSKAKEELGTYWLLLGQKCANKGLLTKDPARDVFLLYYMDTNGKLWEQETMITQAGVSMRTIFQREQPLSKDDVACKQARDNFLKRVSECPGYAPVSVKKEMNEWASYISSYEPKTYAICEQVDPRGTRQVYILYLDQMKVQELLLRTLDNPTQFEGKSGKELEKALCLSANQRNPTLVCGKHFNAVKEEYNKSPCTIS